MNLLPMSHRLIPKSLDEFATRAYANHDRAHDHLHALSVFLTALTIISGEGIVLTDVERKELPYVMIGHDFLDHKLAKRGIGLPAKEIEEFYVSSLGRRSADKIIHIHDNCSWSKRGTSIPLRDKDGNPNSEDWMRRVLQDADWLKAIGDVGLQRCIDYTLEIGGNIPDDVCKHIREKLLLIPSALNYATSRKLAEGELKPLEDYLKHYERV